MSAVSADRRKHDREVGAGRPGRVVAAERLLAPRIPDLEGMRLGVLDDTKWNANRLSRKTRPGSPARRAGRAPAVKP